MNVFQLGRMRWLDLLALYYQANPDSHHDHAGTMAPNWLAVAMLDARAPKT